MFSFGLPKVKVYAEAALSKNREDAEGLSRSLPERIPTMQAKLRLHLKKIRASDERTRKGGGLGGESPVPDSIRLAFLEVTGWFEKNTLTSADDRELKEQLGEKWNGLSVEDLHDRLHRFYLLKRRTRLDYQVASVRGQDLTLRWICGGVCLGEDE